MKKDTRDSFERKSVVARRLGISYRHLNRMVREGSFPSPIYIGPNLPAFRVSEVDDWIAARLAERDAKLKARTDD